MSSKIKKFFLATTIAVLAVGIAVPAGTAQAALTDAQIQSILDLLSSFGADSATISNVSGALHGEATSGTGDTGTTGAISGIPSGFTFAQNLSQGNSNADVKYLQILLNSSADTKLADSGAGSPGNETEFFGPITRSGVIKFQDKYAADVLTPVGLTAGTGFFGPSTRSKANTLVGAAVVPPPPVVDGGDGEPPVVDVSGNTLDVRIASDTPVGVKVADNANANFTKMLFTAGSSDITISKMYVTRQGLTANSDLENVKVLDAGGVNLGSVGSFNVNNKATITFTPNITVSANTTKTLYIRAGIADAATGGLNASLGIVAASDIVSSASNVTGSFPVIGNSFETISLTIGSASVDEDGTTVDSKPDVGDTDVVVNQFYVSAGSTEAITIEQITVLQAGTSALTDTANVELYDVTNSKSLGTVASWTAGGKASWTGLNIAVAKGNKQRFRVQLDILDNPGTTVNVDLVDGSDALIDVKGNTYGFYITPTVLNSWGGQGSASQNINSGTMTVTKSSSTPATGTMSAANDQDLAVFDFIVQGEEMRVTAMALDFDFTGLTYDEVTSVRLYDSDGDIVAGPLDVTVTTLAVSFTDTFFVPVGTSSYTVRANIATTSTTGDTVDVGVNTPATMTVKGLTSNTSVVPTPATEVEGNTLTVAAGSLSATTLTTPAARSVAPGLQDFIWATFTLNAGSSGENVNVTAVQIQNTPGTASADEIDNVELWADLTSAASSRGDKYETKVSGTKQFSTATVSTAEDLSITLNQTLVVPKGLFVNVAVVADLASSTEASDTFLIALDTDANDVTATGASTGQTVSVTATGSGQTMTVAASGTLTVSKDASSPDASLLVAGDTGVTTAIFRLAANNVEPIELDNITFQVTGGARAAAYVAYVGGVAVGTAPSSTTPRMDFADGTVVVPANGHIKLTVKADLETISLTADQDTAFTVNIDHIADVGATGKSSGATATISGTASGSTHQIFEAYPKFTVNSASPSGNLFPSSAALLAIFDVTAVGNEDITFSASLDSLTINVNQSVADSDTSTNTWTLKDAAGNTLDSQSVAAEAVGFTTVDFKFATAGFTISAGTTKSLYVYGDTTDLEDDGDSIQLYLDDGLAAGKLKWSIDADGGAYEHPDIIFRGDIFAGSFVNPS